MWNSSVYSYIYIYFYLHHYNSQIFISWSLHYISVQCLFSCWPLSSTGHWGPSYLAPVSLWVIFISVCEGKGHLREWPSPEFYALHHPHLNTPTGKEKEIHLPSKNFIWSGFQKVWGESRIKSVFWCASEDLSLLMRSKNHWF